MVDLVQLDLLIIEIIQIVKLGIQHIIMTNIIQTVLVIM
jgi:hypothetical protein